VRPAQIPSRLVSRVRNGVDGGRGSYEGVVDEPGQRLNANQQAQRREKRVIKRLGGKTRRRALQRDGQRKAYEA